MDEAADEVLTRIRRLVEDGASEEQLDRASAQLAQVLAAGAVDVTAGAARLAHLAHDLSGLDALVASLPVRTDEQERMSVLLRQARSSRSAGERQRSLTEFTSMAADALRGVTRREIAASAERAEAVAGAESEKHLRLVRGLLLQLVDHLDALHGNALRSHALRERLQHIDHFDQLEHFISEMSGELEAIDERIRGERGRIADFLGTLRDRIDGCELELQLLDTGDDGSAASIGSVLGERLVTLRNEAGVLQNEIRNKTDIALKDPLTGVYSREGFDERVAELMERWKTTGMAFSVVLVECLDFRVINEQRGHAVGDRVLVRVADLLQSRARAGDVLCRYESDRFVVMLPATAVEGAEAFAGSVCQAIAQRVFEDRGEALRLQLACGVTGLVVGDTAESVIGRAGEALYEARRDAAGGVAIVL
jgi:diguanylate cyclase